jgi:UDP-N-acetylmuramate--alanine ligase
VVTYGFRSENDWQAVDLRANAQGGYDFRIVSPPNPALEGVQVVLDVPGLHNVYNALATLVVAQSQGVDPKQAAEVLGHFRGVGRRFEVKGEANGIIVIDDYAHHPTEIKATLAAARTRFGQRPIWVVFQPHTFSRTISLFDDFLGAFGDADHVIVVDIYASREQNDSLISSRDLVNQMAHPDVRYIGPLSDAVEYLLERLAPPAALITLGAGDGDLVGEQVLKKLGDLNGKG